MKKLFFTFAVIAIIPHASNATEAPTMGIAHNTVEPNALTYDCRREGGELLCKFIQTRVRRLADPKDEKTYIAEEITKYRKSKEIMPAKECNEIQKNATALKNGVPPEGANPKAWEELMSSPIRKKKILDDMEFLVSHCKNPSEATFSNIVRSGFLTRARTCRVSSFPFEQRFKYFSTTNTWVVTQAGSSGPCGIVDVSKFEPEQSGGLMFWRYVSKKIVTNKNGQSILMKCSDLDEGEYLFDWRSNPRDMGCDVIEFGAF